MQVAAKSRETTSSSDTFVRPRLLDGYISNAEVCRQLGKSRFTIWKWENDPTSGFPRARKVGCSCYYEVEALRRWIAARVASRSDDKH
jgi:predicted DNA-binding transcriptional regulator AlpA